MKIRLHITDTITNKISFYLLLAFLVTLPFDMIYSETALVCLVIHTLIHLQKKHLHSIRWRSLVLLISVYLLTCLGTAYTSYTGEAFYEWERQLALLLFPFVLSVNTIDLRKYTMPLLVGLTASCTLTILFLYYDALHTILYYHLPLKTLFSKAFLNHNFSMPIDLHATYFSMYIVMSAVTVLYLLIAAQSNRRRLSLLIVLFILLAGMIQLAARATLIAFLVINLSVIPLTLLKKQHRLKFLSVVSFVSLLIIFFILNNESFRNRYIADFKKDLVQNITNMSVLEPRAVRWECAWVLVKQSPVLGHGSGSEITLLKEEYFRRRYYYSYLNELNAHNQYLSFMVKTGFTGFLIFLLLLFKGFKKAIRTKDVFFLSFLVLITTVSFSENILDVNKGIFFVAFFFPLFYLSAKKGSINETSSTGKAHHSIRI